MDRADVSAFNSTEPITLPLPFSKPTATEARQTCNQDQYDDVHVAVESKALQTVVFEYDYSLAPKVYNNVNNNYGRSWITLTGALQFIDITSNSTGTTNTGRLTLKKVHMYGEGYEKVSPPYEFSYDGNPNPEYDHVQKDMFGYYKGNNSTKMASTTVQRGIYITPATKDDQDAWSLSEIKTPGGKLIKPEYESDEYQHVMAESGGNYEDPVRIFRIDQIFGSLMNDVNEPLVYLENDDLNDFITYQNGDILSKTAYFSYRCSGASSDWEIDNTIDGITQNATNTYSLDLSSTDPCSSFQYSDQDRMGYIKLAMYKVYGGGIRTKRITIQNAFNLSEAYITDFQYEDGVIGHDPSPYHLSPKVDNEHQRLTKSLVADARHMGPAMVGYSKVTATFQDRDADPMGKMVFEFNNYAHKFRPSLEEDDIDTWSTGLGHFHSDYWASIQCSQSDATYGKLKKRSVFDQQNKLMASEEWFHTLPTDRGKVVETFHLAFKRAGLSGNEDGIVRFRLLCSRVSFSPWLSKKIEYKEGIYTTTYYDNLHISGKAGEVRVEEGTAQYKVLSTFQEGVVPGFGSKHINLSKTNQLTALASSEPLVNGYSQREVDYHLYNAFPTRLNDDGAFVTQSEVDLYRLNTETVEQNSEIKTVKEVLLRDPAGNMLGWKDVTDMEYASLVDLSGRNLEIATVQNANYASFTYSGFEHQATYSVSAGSTRTYADGEMELLTGATVMTEITGVKPHTGDKMLRLTSTSSGARFRTVEDNQTVSGDIVMNGLQTGRTYHVSVWVHEDSPSTATLNAVLNGTSSGNPINISISKTLSNFSIEAGDWKLLSLEIDVPDDYESSGNSNNDLRIILKNTSATPAYFDDLKFYPVDATLTARVNDDRWRRPLCETTNDDLYTRMEYDHAGRVKNIYTEHSDVSVGEKLVQSHEYGFKRELE